MKCYVAFTLNLLCVAVMAVLMFALLGCGSDEKPRPIKSSTPTCCQPK